MASSSSVFTNQRAQAGLCWIAAAELLALILQLAGAIPYVGMLDTVLSVADGRVRRMKHDMLQSVARKHHGGVDHLEQNGDQGPDAGT